MPLTYLKSVSNSIYWSACPFKVNIVSEHKADRNYVAVSAASIIAKVERDREISFLEEIYGDFGSGYPSDERTIDFLRHLVDASEEYPDFVRKSWKPARMVKDGKRNASDETHFRFSTLIFWISQLFKILHDSRGECSQAMSSGEKNGAFGDFFSNGVFVHSATG